MPIFILKIKADLENIQALTPIEGNHWKLDIQSPGGEETRQGVTVSSEDVIALEGSRGEANFTIKWPFSRQQGYMKIVPHKTVKPAYKEEDAGKFVAILALECRGLEPVAWYAGKDFTARTTGDRETVFEEVDLSEGDWAEFDEENDLSVSVMNVETKLEVTQ